MTNRNRRYRSHVRRARHPIICIRYRAPRASSTKSRQIQIKLVKLVSITVAWCITQFLVGLLLRQLVNGGARKYAVLSYVSPAKV